MGDWVCDGYCDVFRGVIVISELVLMCTLNLISNHGVAQNNGGLQDKPERV